jgi:hypothetical protein
MYKYLCGIHNNMLGGVDVKYAIHTEFGEIDFFGFRIHSNGNDYYRPSFTGDLDIRDIQKLRNFLNRILEISEPEVENV